MIIVFPYKNGSKSVKALKEVGNGVEIKREKSLFKGAARKKVINWGSSALPPEVDKCNVLNKPNAVAVAGNKLTFFIKMAETKVEGCVPFTTSKDVVLDWLAEGKEVVARTKLNAHSGEGIVLFKKGDWIPEAQLYTLYVPKKQEYRVHVCCGKVIDIQRKARKMDVVDEKVNWKIRNLDGGFIYARDFQPEDLPKGINQLAISVVNACGLDFGAVDIIYNEKNASCYVLEVNTAPGLQGTTLEAYTKAFTELGYIFEV